MFSLIYAFRSATVVLGITAFATLLSHLITNSGVNQYLIGHQLTVLANSLDVFSYAIGVFIIGYFYSGFYWRDLFPERLNWLKVIAYLCAGVGFAVFLNHPLQIVLFKQILGQTIALRTGMLIGLSSLLTLTAVSTVVATPLIEELTYRGILFREGERLPIWQLAIISTLLQSLVQFAGGGLALLVTIVPAIVLFVVTRIVSKSFVYSACTHIGFSAALLLKLQLL